MQNKFAWIESSQIDDQTTDLGSGCGTVGSAVASYTRRPRFE